MSDELRTSPDQDGGRDESGRTGAVASREDEEGVPGGLRVGAGEGWRCALNEWEPCDRPAPPPAVDAEGRRKGGKPPKYCSKAHADRASQLRRRAAATVTDGALHRFQEAFDQLVPGLRDTAAEIAALLELGTEIRTGLLERVATAERAEADARAEARAAEQAADTAARSEARARAAARDATEAREKAERDARRAVAEADRRDREAAERIAEHERVRGAAETERDLAVAAREEARSERDTARSEVAIAVTRLRELDEELRALRADRDERAARLEAVTADLAEARRQHAADTATIADLTAQVQRHEQESERLLREAAAQMDAVRTQAEQAVAQAEAQRRRAEEEATELRNERDDARTDLAVDRAARTAQFQALERERDAARAEAAEQRERAALAEQRAANVSDTRQTGLGGETISDHGQARPPEPR
ncbi:hypothetical protein [Actinomadura fibrosa]|uniref:Chromosome segregation ATPase n=1 Tax=Actinomadura fibrosa TaxID=111802 RepID=A0ABW2XZT8_9ACTN|nr:hypothetical protein [Actinomadura fibrosa]